MMRGVVVELILVQDRGSSRDEKDGQEKWKLMPQRG